MKNPFLALGLLQIKVVSCLNPLSPVVFKDAFVIDTIQNGA